MTFRDSESNLVAHARCELALLGDQDDPMNAHMNRDLMAMVETFAAQHHSGFSAAYAIGTLTKLLDFEPLTPLTGEPDEWLEVADGMFQNRRCGRVFSRTGTPDGYAYDIYGRVFVDPDGSAFTNRDSHVPVTFPYTPRTERVQRGTEPPAALPILWPPDETTVERMAGVLHQYHHIAGCDCSPTAWTAWTDEARAVLDALGGAPRWPTTT